MEDLKPLDLIEVSSEVEFPKNICYDCIDTLEDLSSFIEISKIGDTSFWLIKPEKVLTERSGILLGSSAIKKENEDNCEICSPSASGLITTEKNAYLKQQFQDTDSTDMSDVSNPKTHELCSDCDNKLKQITSFFFSSVCNELKYKNDIIAANTVENDDCLSLSDIELSTLEVESIISERENKHKNNFEEGTFIHENQVEFDDSNKENVETVLAISTERNQQGGSNFYHQTLSEKSSSDTTLGEGNVVTQSEKPFKCRCCEKSFSQEGSLNRHMLIHAGEKPFKCECCYISFNQKGNLKRHMLIHTDQDGLFKCECCDKSFTRRAHVKRHMLTHTDKKPFRCDNSKKNSTPE